MLEDGIKARIRALYQHLGTQPGFRPRAAQRQMIGALATHLGHIPVPTSAKAPAAEPGPVAVVEGPTGVGKTLGYLAAVLPVAQARHKKVVIATATVPLQQQILEQDLPRLCTPESHFEVALAKGRRRYACISRLRQLAAPQAQTPLFEGTETLFATATANPVHGDLLAQWDRGDWDGERDSLADAVADDDWLPVTTDRSGCLGPRCSAFHECPFFAARKRIDEADVVIANHDLVLSDLSLGGGVLLPNPARTVYVFDEAHHLPDKVLGHAAREHTVHGARRWLEQAERLASAAVQTLPGRYRHKVDPAALSDAFDQTATALQALDYPLSDVTDFEGDGDTAVWRLPDGVVPPALAEAGMRVHTEAKALDGELARLWKALTAAVEAGDLTPAQAEAVLPSLAVFVERVANLVGTWELFLAPDRDKSPPTARWVQREIRDSGSVDHRVCASPISAAEPLRRLVWSRCAGAVLTSATLTALGRFEHFLGRSGLRHRERVLTLALPSPFDYARRAVLEVPALRADPRDTERHTAEIVQWAGREISVTAGTLMLFTSHRQMRAVRDHMPKALQDIALMQGDGSRHALLQRHRARIDAGQGSLLMGVRSLAEGVDLPGDYCTHVVIAKLPFAVPDSPVEAATAEWFERIGRNPFLEITLPDASVQLTQMVGRLLRTETDAGRVTILDRRLVTRRYGRTLLDALPPIRRAVVAAPTAA